MKEIEVGGRKVLECPLCHGTGICRQAQLRTFATHDAAMKCGYCGEGLHFYYDAARGDNPAYQQEGAGKSPQRPVCKICAGRGYTVP